MVLFADLNESDFNLIHAPIDNFEFKPGQKLFDEDDAVQGIFTLRSGMVKLVRTAQDGRVHIVRMLRTSDIAVWRRWPPNTTKPKPWRSPMDSLEK